ncbi:hypothetical protein [Streptomyces hydrogenans]|uniref:hypothetical protein n=1 Tax=Streptomyces hydrogenans TaxID=1873719 RepID=UPI0033EB24A9
MALRRPQVSQDDPRLKGHETDYSSSRGGWVKKSEPKSTPGAGTGGGRLFGKKK